MRKCRGCNTTVIGEPKLLPGQKEIFEWQYYCADCLPSIMGGYDHGKQFCPACKTQFIETGNLNGECPFCFRPLQQGNPPEGEEVGLHVVGGTITRPEKNHPMDKNYLQDLGRLVSQRLPDGHGFILFSTAFTEEGAPNRMFYISNIKRESAVRALKEWLIQASGEEDWMKHLE